MPILFKQKRFVRHLRKTCGSHYQGCDFINNAANAISASRFIFTVLILCAVPFSALFWAAYICGGLSDLIDGPIARGLKQQSQTGAKLDSAADLVFIIAILVSVLRSIVLPDWLLLFVSIVALVRIAAYAVGYFKYYTFASLHTILNKAAGALLFLFPALLWMLGLNAAGLLVCIIALLSALEELAIIVISKELDRNRKSLFIK